MDVKVNNNTMRRIDGVGYRKKLEAGRTLRRQLSIVQVRYDGILEWNDGNEKLFRK